MNVALLTSPASIKDMENFAALAYLTCHANTDKDYVPHEKLVRAIKARHESILEHINLTFSIKDLSRACLQELARHRHISLSVESTRHTLKKNTNKKFIDDNFTYKQGDFGLAYWKWVEAVHFFMFAENHNSLNNDELKYFLPEFWPTNLIITLNIREFRHILNLRTAPQALKEFRILARSMFNEVPDEFKYLLQDCVHQEEIKND